MKIILPTLTILFSLAASLYSVAETAYLNESFGASAAVICDSVPAKPGAITAQLTKVCPGDSDGFFVPAVAGVTYEWTLPTGMVEGGGGSNNVIYVAVNSSFPAAGGTVSVKASNACGTSAAQTIHITRNTPATPGAITAQLAKVCPGDSDVFSVPAVPGMTYQWTLPTGIIEGGGGSNNVIYVLVTPSFPAAGGTVGVTASNNCGTSAAQTIHITRNIPATPGAITAQLAKVCPGDSDGFSVPAVAGVTYQWTLPTGMIEGGGGSNNIIYVAVNSSFPAAGGTVSVTASNNCGTSAAQTIHITRNTPATPGAITARLTKVCPGDSDVFSVPAVPGMTYQWTLPTGIIEGGGGSNNVIYVAVNSSFPAAGGTVSVTASNNCGTSAAQTIHITRNTPATPGAITAQLAKVCPGDSDGFSVPAVPGVTYQWTLPTGMIEGGGGSNNIIYVAVNSSFPAAGGTVSVTASNNCGTSAAQTIHITRNTPATPGAITAQLAKVCPGDSDGFSVPAVPGVTYQWTLPTGMIEGGGGSNNIIYVAVNSSFPAAGGTVSVTASNNCGTSAAQTIHITRNTPATPGAITAQMAKVCPGDSDGFSVPAVAGLAYQWTLPAGMVPGGGGLNNSAVYLVVNTGFPAAGGTVSVTASNNCGTSAAQTLDVTRNNPAIPGAITGPASVCMYTSQLYSIAPVANANSYLWSVPAGDTIQSGETSTTLRLFWSGAAGNVTVRSANSCGSSGARSKAVSISCREAEPDNMTEINPANAEIFPNPTTGNLTVMFTSSSTDKYYLKVFDLTGRIMMGEEANAIEGTNQHDLNLSHLAKGIYIVSLQTGDETQKMKVMVE